MPDNQINKKDFLIKINSYCIHKLFMKMNYVVMHPSNKIVA